MDVFLFYTANFSNNGAWLILEIICLGDLLIDLFTEQGRMAYVSKGIPQTDGQAHSSAHISSSQARVLLTVFFLQTDAHIKGGSISPHFCL